MTQLITLDAQQVRIVAALVEALRNLDHAYEGSVIMPTVGSDSDLVEIWVFARAVLAIATDTSFLESK